MVNFWQRVSCWIRPLREEGIEPHPGPAAQSMLDDPDLDGDPVTEVDEISILEVQFAADTNNYDLLSYAGLSLEGRSMSVLVVPLMMADHSTCPSDQKSLWQSLQKHSLGSSRRR